MQVEVQVPGSDGFATVQTFRTASVSEISKATGDDASRLRKYIQKEAEAALGARFADSELLIKNDEGREIGLMQEEGASTWGQLMSDLVNKLVLRIEN